MAGTKDLIEILDALPIDQLDDTWVKSSWEKDFVELDTLSDAILNDLQEKGYYTQYLLQLRSSLEYWIHGSAEEEVSFWSILVDTDVSYRHLIAFLATLIDTASKARVGFTKRYAGLLAACNYFQLVSISGSGAFKVFNPMLLNQCLDVLRKWTPSGKVERKRKLPSKNSQKGTRNKSRKINKDAVFDMDEEIGEDGSDEEDLSPQDARTLYNALVSALRAFIQFLQNFSLRGSDSSIHRSIQVMCELISPDSGLASSVIYSTFDVSSATSPFELAYVALKQMCSGSQGNSLDIISVVCKQLMERILMLGPNNKMLASQTIPVAYSHSRANAVSFICHLLEQHGDNVVVCARTLIQHLCVKAPDKTEYRAKVAESVITIMNKFNNISYAKMVKWIGTLTNTSKVNNRMMALEILCLLLLKNERQVQEDFPSELQIYLKHQHLIGYIVPRCSDNAASVRARAIGAFSQCIGSKNQIIVNACQILFTPRNENAENHSPRLIPTPVPQTENETPTSDEKETDDQTVSNNEPVISGQTPFVNLNFTPVNNNLSDDTGVLSMLKRRSSDEKVFVRKSTLHAFESLIRLLEEDCQMGIDILEERCRDPSLTVRKQAMQSLSSLLGDLPMCFPVQKAWLNGVLPLILDRETSLQEKCMKCLEEILLQNLCSYSTLPDNQYRLTWSLIKIMAGEEGDNLRRYFQRAVGEWTRSKLIKPRHINILQSHVGTENNDAAWMMLTELSAAAVKFNPDFVVQFWKENCSIASGDASTPTCKYVLKVLQNVAKTVSQEDRQELVEDLSKRLMQFKSPVDLISVTMHTVKKLSDDEKSKDSNLKKLCHDLLQASDRYLSKLILSEDQNYVAEEDTVICHLFTLGEVAQLFPAHNTKHILLLVQSIIASPCITEFVTKCSQGLASSQTSSTSSGSSQNSEPLLQFIGSKLNSRVRGHAFITMGKFCLQDENLAKKCIAALVRELETSSEEAIRNNVVFILCDLCIRYTTLVDQYIPKVAACLNDASPLIRKQTLTLLTMLIQEDYLKWKGVLFFRFITTLLDELKELREFSEFCFVHCLLVRNPNIMFYHFIECIFYFNLYQKHPLYNRFAQDQDNRNIVDLHGKSNFDLRLRLYNFMLQHMTDEHKINLSAKLNQEILAGVVDCIIPLDADGAAVLRDALVILGSKEIKISLIVNKQNEEHADEQDMAAAVIAKVNKNLISKVMKKNVIENIVPIVTSLKHVLETKRSPVLKELMLYLRELIKDFKSEIQEILATDKQLANEIEFDLRKFEEQQREEQQQPLQEAENGRSASPLSVVQASDNSCPPNQSVPSIPSPASNLVKNPGLLSLSKKAMLNSAKKSIERIQQINGERRQSSCANTGTAGANSPLANLSPNPRERQDSTNLNGSPKNGRKTCSKESSSDGFLHRAISTPFPDRCKNITFGPDQNITITPPSPINHNASSRFAMLNSSPLGSPLLKYGEGDKNENVIHLSSPDRVANRTNVWKITPGKCKSRAVKLSSKNQEVELETGMLELNVSSRTRQN